MMWNESHTLRGCVDWNPDDAPEKVCNESHTLRGCVDWNHIAALLGYSQKVTPCVGVWIETYKYMGQDI